MQIIFSIPTEYGVYTDALNLPDDHTYTESELESMKQERVANWITIITTLSEETNIESSVE